METDYTRKFSIRYEKDPEIKEVLTSVYNSLQEKGYNPINQIVGYILSEDPTYITNYNNARALIRKLDRDELLQTDRSPAVRVALNDRLDDIGQATVNLATEVWPVLRALLRVV